MALSVYLQAGAAKKPAFWLDKFNISCQESEMLKSRRASPHGFGRNKKTNKKKQTCFGWRGYCNVVELEPQDATELLKASAT